MKFVDRDYLRLFLDKIAKEYGVGKNFIWLISRFGHTPQVFSADYLPEHLHFEGMVHDLEPIVQVLDLGCLIDHFQQETEHTLVEDLLNGQRGLVCSYGGAIAKHAQEAESLRHCFIVVSAEES